MTDNNTDATGAKISYYAVLEKFDGDSTDEKDLTERIHIEDDIIVRVDKFENGELVSSEDRTEDFAGGTNE